MWARRAFVATATILSGMLWMTAPAAMAGGGGGGCLHGTPATDGRGTTVEMVDMCFTPTVLHASAGDTVTFVNRDGFDHTVTGVGGSWGTFDGVRAGDSVAYAFGENGVYVYACLLHPGMAGAIVVGDGSGSPGLEPASVQPADAADTMATAADAAVANGGGGVSRATVVAVAGLVLGAVAAAVAIAHRRRDTVGQLDAPGR
jgi:plastocyanin